MAHSAKVLADSISPDGVRLTTLEVTFPRIVLAEFNTHRVFSRNSASSRAIPVEKMLKMVQDNPYVPTHWGKNQKGMQAEVELSGWRRWMAIRGWMLARRFAIFFARFLLWCQVHKQITNRLLEPFMWHTVIVTGTEWDNFYHLRANPKAHPEIKLAAELMRDAMEASTPSKRDYGQWHLPLLGPGELKGDWDDLCKVGVGRCARISYLTHDGKRDPVKDIELHDNLLAAGHMSPFEHVARPMKATGGDNDLAYCNNAEAFDGSFNPATTFSGNFRGWVSYRKQIPHEEDILGQH